MTQRQVNPAAMYSIFGGAPNGPLNQNFPGGGAFTDKTKSTFSEIPAAQSNAAGNMMPMNSPSLLDL